MKKLILFAVAITVLAGCRGNNQRRADDRVRQDIESIDMEERREMREERREERHENREIAGTYKGTLPCADCDGIEVSLRLERDGDYVLKTKHLSNREGEEDIESKYEGTFDYHPESRIITLNGITNQPNRYLVSGDDIIQLDMDGERITGPHADMYILKK